MALVHGVVRETVYSGPTTTYLIELAPGVTVSVLEQNTDRSRMEDRWSGGESVEIGWKPEHCLVLD
ncbi:TOBE domain-containing protein [Streptomyces libani]